MICKKLLTVVTFLFVGSNFCVGSDSIQSLSNLDAECKGQNVSMSKNEYFENISDKGTDFNSDKSNSPEMTNKTIEVVQPEALSEAEQAYKELAKSYPIQLIDWDDPSAVAIRRAELDKEFSSCGWLDSNVVSGLIGNVCAFEKVYSNYDEINNVLNLTDTDYSMAFGAIQDLKFFPYTTLSLDQIRVHMPFVVRGCISEFVDIGYEPSVSCVDVIDMLVAHSLPTSTLSTLYELFCNKGWLPEHQYLFEDLMNDFALFLQQTFPNGTVAFSKHVR